MARTFRDISHLFLSPEPSGGMGEEKDRRQTRDVRRENVVEGVRSAHRESAQAAHLGGKHTRLLLPEYLRFFGLVRNPFSDTLNVAFFYEAIPHKRTLQRLAFAVSQRQAFALVTGKTGTGKSLICKILAAYARPPRYLVISIPAHPGMRQTALLREILWGLLSQPRGLTPRTVYALLERIRQIMLQKHALAQHVVLLIDEAGFLRADCLHQLRSLSNLEVGNNRPLSIVLLAEELFLNRLRRPHYQALRSRIWVHERLLPLSETDTQEFLIYRLKAAGGDRDIFSAEACHLIHEGGKGICREVMKIADSALYEAFVRKERTVTDEIVSHCIQETLF